MCDDLRDFSKRQPIQKARACVIWPLSFRSHDENLSDLRQMHRMTLPELPPFPTTVAPIDRLPPEMLVAIFAHLSKREPGHIPSHFVQGLVSVTHICRFWREVAINAPDLWAEVKMTNLEGVKVFLERSSAVPLNVSLRLGSHLGTETNRGLLEVVAPHAHRVRLGQGFGLPVLFTKPAPLFERLEIHYFQEM